MRTGLYAGSFDPLTNGHLWTIERGAALFSRLLVAVGINPTKKYTFETRERIAMIEEAAAHLPNVTAIEFSGRYLVHFAMELGATHILRGIRTPLDFQEEMTIRHVNDDIGELARARGLDGPIPTTVYLIPPRPLAEVSSSLVKGLVGGDPGWREIVSKYVPAPVFARLSRSG